MYQSSSKPSYHRGSGRSNSSSSGSSHGSHGSNSSSSVDMSAAQRTIHIGNLISSITDEMLINYFAKCGSITNLKLAGNPSYPARFAFIEFATVQQAHAACALAGTLIGGKPIKIAIAKNPITTPYTPSSSTTTTTTAATAAAAFAPVSVSMYDTSSAGALYQQQQQQQYPTTTTTAQDTAYYYSQFATNNTTSSDYSLQQHQQAPSSFDYSQQQQQQQQQYHPYQQQQQPSHYAQTTATSQQQPTHDYSYHSTTLPTNNDHHYSIYQQQQQQPSSSYAPYSSYPSTTTAAVGGGGGGTQSSSHYSHPKHHHHHQQQQQQQQLKKTIYIAGIDKELSEQAIINYFAKCGEIVNHRFCMGQPSKFAFIEYATHESAASAIQNFSGTWLGKCTLKVSFSKSPIQQQSQSSSQMPHAHSHHHHKSSSSSSSSSSLNPQQLEMISRTVHVGNLDGHLSENEIQQFFNDTCGGGGRNVIERFSMAGGTPVEHGKVARFCFIEFTNVTSAQMALQLNGTMLGSLNIRVSPSRSPILSSSSSASSTMNKQALTHNQRYVATQSLTNENVTPHLFSDNSAYNNGSSTDSNNKFDASAILSSLKPRSILKKVQEQLQNQQQEDGSSDKSHMTKKVSNMTTKTSATVKEPRTPPGSPPADLYVRQKALIMKEQQQQANRKRAREEERATMTTAATDEDETTGSTKSLDVISPKRAKITHDENQSHDSSASGRDTTDHQ